MATSSAAASTASARALRDSRIGVIRNQFLSSTVQLKYDVFNSNTPLFSWPVFIFFIFAVASTLQYCSLWPAGINGEFGPVIRISFCSWIAGITALLTSLGAELAYRRGWIDRNRGIQLRNFAASLFILLQPLVHGCLIYGRTLSPRVCRPEGYNDKTRSIIAVMEEQMTCNTSSDGRIPPELTVCMAILMLVHQSIFQNVNWLVIVVHWSVGLVFLILAHLQALSDNPESMAHGEAVVIVSCYFAFYFILYVFERRKKEMYVLTLQLNKSGGNNLEETRSQFVLQKTSSSLHPTASISFSPSSRSHGTRDDDLSSITMSEFNPGAHDPYDDYDQYSVNSSH